ncbi:ABC transporter permease [Gemmatimonadota bacterium]
MNPHQVQYDAPIIPGWLSHLLPLSHRHQVVGDLSEEYATGALGQPGSIGAQTRFWWQFLRSIVAFNFQHARNQALGYRNRRRQPNIRIREQAFLESIRMDIRFAVRTLLKRPGFTVVAVLTLALGISTNTTIFSVVEGVVLRPLPYEEPEALVGLWETPIDEPFTRSAVTFPNWRDWQELNSVFEDVALYHSVDMTLLSEGELPAKVTTLICSSGYFPLLRMVPAAGRFFTAEEDTPEAERTVVLSYAFWQSRFDSNPDALRQTISLDGTDYRIIGVTDGSLDPTIFEIDTVPQLFLPIGMDTNWHPQRAAHVYFSLARLLTGMSLETAQMEMDAIAAGLAEQYPDENVDMGIAVVPFVDQVLGDVRTSMFLLLGAVALVLLIACANVANMVLARGISRCGEVAVRCALGADRRRLIRQLLTESLVLAMAAGLLGIIFTFWGIDAVIALIPDDVPRIAEIGLNQTVLIFTLVLTIITGILFGLLPALRSSRSNLSEMMKEGGRTSTVQIQHRARRLLLVVEVAFTMVLLIGAGLMLRSVSRLLDVDPGYNPENVLTFGLDLPGDMPAVERESLQSVLLQRIQALGGVEEAAMTSTLPIVRNVNTSFRISGRPREPGQSPRTYYASVSPEFFRVFGIPIEEGRGFDGYESRDGIGAVIISRTLADQYWPDEDSVGQQITIGLTIDDGSPEEYTIVGIAGDVRHNGRAQKTSPTIYLSSSQHTWWGVLYIVRTRVNPLTMVDPLRREVASLLPKIPIYDIGTLTEHLTGTEAERRFVLLALTLFSTLSLIMAAAGIYSVISYAVNDKVHEIGMRMALGASRSSILRMVIGSGLGATAVGIGIGLAGAFGLSRFLSSLLFEVESTNPIIYVVVAMLITGTAVVACWVPASRASRIDPATALRCK